MVKNRARYKEEETKSRTLNYNRLINKLKIFKQDVIRFIVLHFPPRKQMSKIELK